jgi:hypothetical protein
MSGINVPIPFSVETYFYLTVSQPSVGISMSLVVIKSTVGSVPTGGKPFVGTFFPAGGKPFAGPSFYVWGKPSLTGMILLLDNQLLLGVTLPKLIPILVNNPLLGNNFLLVKNLLLVNILLAVNKFLLVKNLILVSNLL